jgi:very-short-patch-repair endonuclease
MDGTEGMDKPITKGPLSPRETTPGMEEVERRRMPKPRDRVRGSKKLLPRARELRRRSSEAERVLWKHLRQRRLNGYKFRRQVVIEPYIVDFVCMDAKLIIEADGGQHADQVAYDARRTARLEDMGYRIIRFWNNEILRELHSVLEKIASELIDIPSLQPPSGEREG